MTPQDFYMSALALGFTSRRAKAELGWSTAKGKTTQEMNAGLAALKALSDVRNQERQGSR